MRNGNTYRAARRNAWREQATFPWQAFNRRDASDKNDVGTRPSYYVSAAVARSKYMPHIGNKERGRYA